MEATGVLSIVWFVGSLCVCVLGCHRSRVLSRRIRILETKLEQTRNPQVVYSVPVSNGYMPPPSGPSAPLYENPL